MAAFRENAKEEEAARLRAQIELMTSQLQERDAAVAEWEAAMQEQKVRCVCVCVRLSAEVYAWTAVFVFL